LNTNLQLGRRGSEAKVNAPFWSFRLPLNPREYTEDSLHSVVKVARAVNAMYRAFAKEISTFKIIFLYFNTLYRASFIILCYDQQIHTIISQIITLLQLTTKTQNICVIKTNFMHYLSSVYYVNQPLHVSAIFVAHHQEVYRIHI
jgi:hypothetical protein